MSKKNSLESFFKEQSPAEIIHNFGSPVYVYSETILRERCRQLKNFVSYPKFIVDYSIKANSNPTLLKIIREEGLKADVVSQGEIYLAEYAGYRPKEIFYVCNNVSPEEMQYAINRGIRISVDSLSQLEQYGRLNPGGEICIRINPGTGAGHHKKVVTAGKNTKFGINTDSAEEIKNILESFHLKLIGINQHIGSLFLSSESFLRSSEALLNFASEFPGLEFIDLGGGYGVPYEEGESKLDLNQLGQSLDLLIRNFTDGYGHEIYFRIEPGRYIVAECGLLLGSVHGIKYNGEKKYIGTDIGFNVLMRPILYDSYHEIEIYRDGYLLKDTPKEAATVVGNICESGDILANDRMLPMVAPGDIIAVKNAGAYGHVMSSTYNGRLRPAELLVTDEGNIMEIRKRDSYEDLVRNYIL